MGIGDTILIGAVFFKKPELSKPEFNQRLGRWFITKDKTMDVANQLEQQGLIKVVKRNNVKFFQRIM